MNATLALHAAAPATAPVTPVADAVLAPGASDAAHPLFSLMLGQAPAEDAGSSDTADAGNAAEAAIAPWLMALDSQQAPALPFTQPFSRLLGAAAREAGGEGTAALAEAADTLDAARPTAPQALLGLPAAPRTPGAEAGLAPSAAAAPLADAAGAAPSNAHSPARSLADTAAARALPADATALASAARPAREPASLDGFAAVFNANANSSDSGANEPVVRLDPARTELWQRPLAHALGERVQWQSAQGIDQARIRLDPPALGRIEIVVRQEGAQLQVQLTASSPEVARQLQHMGEGLRQELGQRQGQGVQVQVQAHDGGAQADARGQQRQGQSGRDEAEPGQALRGEHDPSHRFTLA